MPSPDKKIWFPAKKYGWGWGPPRCWQGWAVLAAYLALLAGGVFLLLPSLLLVILYGVVIATLLVLVCYLKGEKPRWRWGDPRA